MNQRAAGPEFAMSFTQDAVCLERREGHDWQPVGQALFAGGGMAATLNALRDEAGGSGDDAADVVLVIPDDQVLYTSVTVPVGSDTPTVIGRILESMTPYRAEDLAFDWCPAANGDIETLRVAAVARRTLDEAEEFARAQGFRPSGYLSRPGDERFDGLPDFGLSKLARQQTERPPFSQPDLSRARITAPVITDDGLRAPAAISRIVPHVAPVAPAGRLPDAAPVQPAAASAEGAPSNDLEQSSTKSAGDARAGRADMAAVPDTDPSAAPVIRHGERKPIATPLPVGGPKPRLSPRAEAIHARAGDARARRESEPAAPAASALLMRLRQFNPGRLSVLMAALVGMLVLVLVLFGGRGDKTGIASPAEPAATAPEPATPAVTAAATTPSEPAEPPVLDTIASADPAAAAGVPDKAPAQPDSQADGALTRALREAMTQQQSVAEAASRQPVSQQPAGGGASPVSAATMASAALENAPTGTATPETATAATKAADRPTAAPTAEGQPGPEAAAAPDAPAAAHNLASSARPPRAAPARATQPARPDGVPSVPRNPQPFAQRSQPEPPRVAGIRPPERPAAGTPRATPATARPAATPAPASAATTPPEVPATRPAGSSRRPPSRPDNLGSIEEGSAAEDGQPKQLTRAERQSALQLLRDLRKAEVGPTGLDAAERGALIVLAQARPQRKPVSVGAAAQRAVENALTAAIESSARPESRSGADVGARRDDRLARLARSVRPPARPGERNIAKGDAGGGGPGNASLTRAAIDDAIASAVSNSSAMPGAVALTALSSSALPPRRNGGASETAAAPAAPTADDLRAAAEAQQEERAREAALAEQRRQDAELQAQAEARARAQAAADARAEAQARAQAEARARAQVEAERLAATRRQRSYTPPEAENEPEVRGALPDGRITTTAAATATVKEGIQVNRTQIIGTIGAGKASRALIRLSNGRVLTLRLGDRINGGTITEIGNSRITFVKGGRAQQLAVLNGQ